MIRPKPPENQKNKDLATSPEVRVVVETLFFFVFWFGLIMNHDQSGLILSGSETEHSVAVPNTWFCEETCGSRQSERTV